MTVEQHDHDNAGTAAFPLLRRRRMFGSVTVDSLAKRSPIWPLRGF